MNPITTPRARSPRWIRVIASAALLLLLGQIFISPPARAATTTATIAIASFDGQNINGFQLNQSAQLVGNDIQLTPATGSQSGSAFWKNQVSLANQRSFSTYFAMEMKNPGGTAPGGADGIVFVIQTQSNTAGGTGGGIGYSGISPSVGVEFDTWANNTSTDPNSTINDPDDNHVGLDVGGSAVSVVTSSPAIVIQDGIRHVWIDYNGATSQLEVRMSATSNARSSSQVVLQTTRNLASDVGQDVYIGFTAGTGGAYEDHLIKSFYFVNDYAPIDIGATPPNIYNQAPFGVAVSPSPASIATGASSTITATVRDVSGNPLANQPVTFSTSLGSLATSSGTTDASGQVSVTLNGGAAAGTATIRATAAGGVFGTTTVAVTGPPLYKVYIPKQIGIPILVP